MSARSCCRRRCVPAGRGAAYGTSRKTRERLADLVLELLAGPHEPRVRADAGRVDDDVFLVEADQVDAGDAARPDRVDRLGDAVAADVLGEVVERPAGEDRKRNAGSTAMPAAHDTVPSPPPTASTSARLAASRSAASMSSPSPSSTISAAGSASRTSSTTRAPVPLPDAGLITSTTPAPSGRGRGVDPQRIGGGDLGRDDRRHDPAAKHRDARADAEAREHVARDSARRRRRGTARPARRAARAPVRRAGSPARHRQRMRRRWPSVRTAVSSTSGSAGSAGPTAPTCGWAVAVSRRASRTGW